MASDNLRGILLMLWSMAVFALEDMFLKWAATSLDPGEILLVSGLCSAAIFWALAARKRQPILTRAALHPASLARMGGEMLGTFAYILALAAIPLSTVSAVLQALPLAVTMAAALFMGAQVGWRRWLAILVGFAGVLLVIQPGADSFRPASLLVLITVAGLTLRDLSTRAIPADTATEQVSAWGMMSVALLGAMMMAYTGAARMPTGFEAAAMTGGVVFGTLGYAAVTAASRTGEVAVVAPFRYARLVFAMIIGMSVFDERPNLLMLFGAALIVGSGLYAFARERARRLKQA